MAPTGAGALGPPYRLYFNEDQAEKGGKKRVSTRAAAESFLNLVEKRSKIVARARSHGQPRSYLSLMNENGADTDEEETVFYENNNLRHQNATPETTEIDSKDRRLQMQEDGRRGLERDTNDCHFKATSGDSVKRHVIAVLLVCSVFFSLYFVLHLSLFRMMPALRLPPNFNVSYRTAVDGYRIDTNLATLPLPNKTRVVFFSANNTALCAKIDANQLVWKRSLIHKIEYVQCNEATCVFYGNNTITALDPKTGGFLWTSRVKARPFLMTTSWGSRIVVFHNEYMIIYRQDTGRSMTHFRIRNCSRISSIQPIGVRLAVFCQQNVNQSSISLYIIPKTVLLHFNSQAQEKPIPADFVGFFKQPVRVHTFNDTVLYILHDRGVVSTLSVTERRVEDILSTSADVREVLPINCTHTLVQTPNLLLVYNERGVVWRKPIVNESLTYVRRLSHNLILLKKNDRKLVVVDIALMKDFLIDSDSYQELLLVDGKEHMLFTASLASQNATIVTTIKYKD